MKTISSLLSFCSSADEPERHSDPFAAKPAHPCARVHQPFGGGLLGSGGRPAQLHSDDLAVVAGGACALRTTAAHPDSAAYHLHRCQPLDEASVAARSRMHCALTVLQHRGPGHLLGRALLPSDRIDAESSPTGRPAVHVLRKQRRALGAQAAADGHRSGGEVRHEEVQPRQDGDPVEHGE